MVDVTLNDLATSNPLLATDELTGEEPIETEFSSTSRGGRLRQLSATPINRQTGAAYTMATTDQSKVVAINRSSSHTFTVPDNATVNFPVNGTFILRREGTGTVTFNAAVGVTINKRVSTGFQIAEQWGQIVFHKTATDTWYVEGGLNAV